MTPKFIKRRQRAFKRWRKSHRFQLTVLVVLLLSALFAYAGYMGNQRLTANPESFRPLLDLIGRVESDGNYNAHFGNSRNESVRFTDMSIAEVKKWQKDYVAQGSPSSAVGRYQFISGTLDGLTRQLDIKPTRKFDEKTQDAMAIALLERRGADKYVNKELTDKEFAANLAKEWAALPKVVGENPDASYYDGDGLNKSRVKPDEVLNAIQPIEADSSSL